MQQETSKQEKARCLDKRNGECEMYTSEQMLVKEMIRNREAYAAGQAAMKRLRRMSCKTQAKPTSPVKHVLGALLRSLKHAHA
jgi:hypothetical protein